MSCITQLLELKGDKPFLPIHGNSVVEGGGVYKDREYLITFTSHGTRCGYVALTPEETERYKKEAEADEDGFTFYPDLECHGGVTFYDNDHSAKDLLPIPCSDMWVGFDCAHSGDGYDRALTKKYFGKETFSDEFYTAMDALEKEVIHRTYKYVEQECQSIIDQLLGKAA